MTQKALVDIDWAERHARILRQDIHLSEVDYLDPYVLAKEMEIELLPITAVRNIPATVLDQLLERDARGWSAGSLVLPNGKVMVIMNPKHTKTRARATLMEEIVHIYLAHQPSKLTTGKDGLATRSYDEQQEQEAYWVGAAALVTMWQLNRARQNRLTVQDLAKYCEVSADLVRFRSRITGIQLAERAPAKIARW